MSEEKQFPAWHCGPNGERQIFNSADEVPKGWFTRRELRKKVGQKEAKVQQIFCATARSPSPIEAGVVELDTAGWPWTVELHASSKGKTKDGLWRMKVGVRRPDPKPGYPLDL